MQSQAGSRGDSPAGPGQICPQLSPAIAFTASQLNAAARSAAAVVPGLAQNPSNGMAPVMVHDATSPLPPAARGAHAAASLRHHHGGISALVAQHQQQQVAAALSAAGLDLTGRVAHAASGTVNTRQASTHPPEHAGTILNPLTGNFPFPSSQLPVGISPYTGGGSPALGVGVPGIGTLSGMPPVGRHNPPAGPPSMTSPVPKHRSNSPGMTGMVPASALSQQQLNAALSSVQAQAQAQAQAQSQAQAQAQAQALSPSTSALAAQQLQQAQQAQQMHQIQQQQLMQAAQQAQQQQQLNQLLFMHQQAGQAQLALQQQHVQQLQQQVQQEAQHQQAHDAELARGPLSPASTSRAAVAGQATGATASVGPTAPGTVSMVGAANGPMALDSQAAQALTAQQQQQQMLLQQFALQHAQVQAQVHAAQQFLASRGLQYDKVTGQISQRPDVPGAAAPVTGGLAAATAPLVGFITRLVAIMVICVAYGCKVHGHTGFCVCRRCPSLWISTAGNHRQLWYALSALPPGCKDFAVLC